MQGSSLMFYIEVISSVLFCASRRKKEPKNADMRGVAPNPSRFLKKATQKLFMSWGVRVVAGENFRELSRPILQQSCHLRHQQVNDD